jgi:O-antigen/teichoic acid export membrane protein
VLNGDLAGRGRPELGSRSAGISLVINVSLNLILIPKWGISGAALSSTVSYTMVSLVMLYYYVKLSGSNAFDVTMIQIKDFKLYTYYLKRGTAWLSTIR